MQLLQKSTQIVMSNRLNIFRNSQKFNLLKQIITLNLSSAVTYIYLITKIEIHWVTVELAQAGKT